MKLGYINIDGLYQKLSSIFLNNDKNLIELDYLVVADTRLNIKNTKRKREGSLSNWIVLGRFDANDERIHMGLLFLKSHKSHQEEIVQSVDLVMGDLNLDSIKSEDAKMELQQFALINLITYCWTRICSQNFSQPASGTIQVTITQ